MVTCSSIRPHCGVGDWDWAANVAAARASARYHAAGRSPLSYADGRGGDIDGSFRMERNLKLVCGNTATVITLSEMDRDTEKSQEGAEEKKKQQKQNE